MTLEEIKANAPEGATHYRILDGNVDYIQKLSYQKHPYFWFKSINTWVPTGWNEIDLSPYIKLI